MTEKPETNAQSKGLTALSDLSEGATREISGALNGLLADVFTLYLKTKNFHWHMCGPHFRGSPKDLS